MGGRRGLEAIHGVTRESGHAQPWGPTEEAVLGASVWGQVPCTHSQGDFTRPRPLAVLKRPPGLGTVRALIRE